MDLLLDTNVLARCIQPSHPLHSVATSAMKEFTARGDHLCILPQIIYEHFVVCTRPPSEYGGLGMSNEAAIAEISRVVALFDLLPDLPAIYPEWIRLIELNKVVGKRAHDARIVAAMNVHGIRAIATFNNKDFSRYANLQILSPHDLATAFVARRPAS